MATSKKSSSKKTVSVELEKAEEKKAMKQPISQVDPALIASIKNQSQIEEEALVLAQQQELEEREKQLKNRLLFYGGIAAAVGILYLAHRYYGGKTPIPPEEFVEELANGVATTLQK